MCSCGIPPYRHGDGGHHREVSIADKCLRPQGHFIFQNSDSYSLRYLFLELFVHISVELWEKVMAFVLVSVFVVAGGVDGARGVHGARMLD